MVVPKKRRAAKYAAAAELTEAEPPSGRQGGCQWRTPFWTPEGTPRVPPEYQPPGTASFYGRAEPRNFWYGQESEKGEGGGIGGLPRGVRSGGMPYDKPRSLHGGPAEAQRKKKRPRAESTTSSLPEDKSKEKAKKESQA